MVQGIPKNVHISFYKKNIYKCTIEPSYTSKVKIYMGYIYKKGVKAKKNHYENFVSQPL